MRNMRLLLSLLALTATARPATIERMWLTHATSDPSKIVINWETDTPSDSAVEFGTGAIGQPAFPLAPVQTPAPPR